MGVMANWLYRTLSSLKTSVWVMGALGVWYLLGTLFPQGVEFEKYRAAGGKYLFVVKALGLLNVFSSPVFIILSILLLVNISVCIYVRIKGQLRSRLRWPEQQIMFASKYSIGLDSAERFYRYLDSRGFRCLYEDETQKVLQKGLPAWWGSWAFHIGMAIAILGFFLTFLAAHESDITLYPDKPVEFSLYSPETRWNRFLKSIGFSVPEKMPEKTYKITLKEFKTTYQEKLALDYPKAVPARMAIGLGLVDLRANKEPEPYPFQYETSFVIKAPDGKEQEATLSVNHPYRQGPLTLYQMGYEQKVTLQIGRTTLEVEPYRAFQVKGLKGKFLLYGIKWGKMKKKDSSEVNLTPQAWLYRITTKGREKLTLLKKGQWQRIEGKRWTIKEFKEASVLSYRVDRGVPLATAGVLLSMAGLLWRVYGRFYRLRLLEYQGKLYIHITAKGLLADSTRLIEHFIKAPPSTSQL